MSLLARELSYFQGHPREEFHCTHFSCRPHKSEEIYHITAGSGLMELGGRQFMVQAGDTVCIDPGSEHGITNNSSGSTELKIIAVSSPPYQHSDTEVV